VDDLAEQLGRLLDDPQLVESYRGRARRRAEIYSWEAVTDQYEELLKAALDGEGPWSGSADGGDARTSRSNVLAAGSARRYAV
jgi:hypothetical protein